MLIHKNIEIINLALLVHKRILIISDLHIGFEEALNRQGVLVPRFHYKDIIKKLENIFQKIQPVEKIIINGDLKHEFGTISHQEWKEITNLFDFLKTRCKELIVIKGNHDAILEPIAKNTFRIKFGSANYKGKEINLTPEYREKGLLVIHGDKVPEKLEDTIIIGHEHPAISLKDEAKVEKFKCFLKGKFKSKILIVQPSFNPSIEGSDIRKEQFLSPFLSSLSNFQVFVVGKEEALDFGKLKNLTIQNK